MGEDAVVQLYGQRKEFVSRAYIFVRNTSIAEQLVDDAFLKLVSKNGSLQEVRDPKAYFIGMLRNVCRDYHRRGKLPVQAFDNVLAQGAVVEPHKSAELSEAVQDALNRIPEMYRTALVHRVIDGMSYQEIAEQYGILPANAICRVSRAKKQMRELLTGVA